MPINRVALVRKGGMNFWRQPHRGPVLLELKTIEAHHMQSAFQRRCVLPLPCLLHHPRKHCVGQIWNILSPMKLGGVI